MPSRLTPELEAIASAMNLLQPLSPDARSRVLTWLDDYFSYHTDVTQPTNVSNVSTNSYAENEIPENNFADIASAEPIEEDSFESSSDTADENYEETFGSFEQFYDYVAPKTARQKVATAGWWLEFEEGQSSWRTFDVTKALKNIGKPLRYLSTTITQEKKKDDPLIEQLSKDGDSAQAHGTFRLSEFGRAFVEGHLPEDYLTSSEDSLYADDEEEAGFTGDINEVDIEAEDVEDHIDDQNEYVDF